MELTDDEGPPQPPSYEESNQSIQPAPKGKPERPAPPYCLVEATSRPCPEAGDQQFDRTRSIALAQQQPPPAQQQQPIPHNNYQPDIVAGHCAKFEDALAGKTGLRICIVGFVMAIILVVISAILGSAFLAVLFIISGIVFLVLVGWSVSLGRRRRKMLVERERRETLNRVQIRETV